ncbi:MAG: acylphosphatase [Ignavibacteriales bacterium]|nr:acylphosphatase [Ignavibacteriales bacterium]
MFRAEIIAKGMVQGVGFRYFILRHSLKLGLKGYTKNLYNDDEILTVVEGEKFAIEELFNLIRIGPISATVNSCNIIWTEYKNEFKTFEVKF